MDKFPEPSVTVTAASSETSTPAKRKKKTVSFGVVDEIQDALDPRPPDDFGHDEAFQRRESSFLYDLSEGKCGEGCGDEGNANFTVSALHQPARRPSGGDFSGDDDGRRRTSSVHLADFFKAKNGGDDGVLDEDDGASRGGSTTSTFDLGVGGAGGRLRGLTQHDLMNIASEALEVLAQVENDEIDQQKSNLDACGSDVGSDDGSGGDSGGGGDGDGDGVEFSRRRTARQSVHVGARTVPKEMLARDPNSVRQLEREAEDLSHLGAVFSHLQSRFHRRLSSKKIDAISRQRIQLEMDRELGLLHQRQKAKRKTSGEAVDNDDGDDVRPYGGSVFESFRGWLQPAGGGVSAQPQRRNTLGETFSHHIERGIFKFYEVPEVRHRRTLLVFSLSKPFSPAV